MEGLESFVSNGKQLDLILMSFVFGAPLGVLYDIFRAVRIIFHHGKIAVFIEDLLYFFIYGVFMMSFTVTAANSEFRFLYPLCNALGFIVYFVTIGSFTRKLLCKITAKTKTIVQSIVKKLVSICAKAVCEFSAFLQIGKKSEKNRNNPLIDDGNLLYNIIYRDKKIKKQKKEREKIWQQTRP